MCSETGPRISFSIDLVQQQHSVIHHHLQSNSTFEFEFSASHHQSCTADELFADGIILPKLHFPQPKTPPRNVSLPPPPPQPELEEKKQRKSLWRFRRSSSLKSTFIFSLPLLSKASPLKDTKNQQLGKKASGSLTQKKKYCGGSNGNISPVLNFPPPYIGNGAATLFGFGSILRHGKHYNKR